MLENMDFSILHKWQALSGNNLTMIWGSWKSTPKIAIDFRRAIFSSPMMALGVDWVGESIASLLSYYLLCQEEGKLSFSENDICLLNLVCFRQLLRFSEFIKFLLNPVHFENLTLKIICNSVILLWITCIKRVSYICIFYTISILHTVSFL